MEIIFAEMNRTINSDEAQWTYFPGPTTCIFSIGRHSRQSRQFSMFYERVKTNNFDYPEDTKRRICQQLFEYPSHTCKYCKNLDKAKKDYDEPLTTINILEK